MARRTRAISGTTAVILALLVARPGPATPTAQSDPEHEVGPELVARKVQEARAGTVDPVFASFLGVQTQAKIRAGDFQAAVRTAEPLVQYSEVAYGRADPRTAAALETLADVYCHLERCAESVPLIERASAVYRAGGTQEETDYVRTLNSLGAAWIHLAKAERAEPVLLQSLKLSEARFGRESRQAGVACLLLAVVYTVQGKDARAATYRERGNRLVAQPGP